MTDAAAEILGYLEGAEAEIAATLSELVRIPTVNPYSGDPQSSGEAAGQRFFDELMRSAGGVTERVPVPADVYRRAGVLGPLGRDFAGRENLVGRFAFGAGGGRLVLNGHMDTVGVAGFEGDPFGGAVDGDFVRGRGAGDCKGGLVAGLFALRALGHCRATLAGEILFESVVEEECSGAGAGTLACCLAGLRGDWAILLDGTAGRILTGCQGIATVEVSVRGRAGHGSFGGVSAVEKLLVAKSAFDRLSAERAAGRPKAAANVGVLRAGTAPWVVPDRGFFSANINYENAEAAESARSGRGHCGALVRERFEKLLAEACAADAWLREHPPELVWTKDAPPFSLTDLPGQAAVERLLAACRRGFELAWGRPGEEGELGAWYDGSHLARIAGMPAVGLGSSEPGVAHTSAEFARVSSVRKAAGAVALAALELLGS